MSTGTKKNRINTKRVKQFLLDHDTNVVQLSERMNKLREDPKEKPANVSTLINGFENFTVDRFKLLVQATGLPPNDLLPWEQWIAETKKKSGGQQNVTKKSR